MKKDEPAPSGAQPQPQEKKGGLMEEQTGGFEGIVNFVAEHLAQQGGGKDRALVQTTASELVSEVSAEVSAEVATETAAETSAEAAAEAVAEISAETAAEISAETAAEMASEAGTSFKFFGR
jgi:hypothetical protein